MKHQFAALAVLATLATGSVAQAPSPEATGDAADQQATTSPAEPDIQETNSNSPEPAATEPELAAEADPPAADPGNQDSPFDYQASEQISEDLSVSFPVDI